MDVRINHTKPLPCCRRIQLHVGGNQRQAPGREQALLANRKQRGELNGVGGPKAVPLRQSHGIFQAGRGDFDDPKYGSPFRTESDDGGREPGRRKPTPPSNERTDDLDA